MKTMKNIAATTVLLACASVLSAQTDVSLFWKKDKKQLSEIISEEAVQYKTVGHHGPAVENMYMALRLYFNNSGAIDIYNKAKPGLELAAYGWYPTKEQIAEGAGCDEYRVGKTTGLGGVSLWDGQNEVKLVATRGREARVEKTATGARMEMLSKGVPYMGDTVDIAVRVEVFNDSRLARVEAECTSGQKVQFATGVNYHKGQKTTTGQAKSKKTNYIGVWGIHPADVVENPLPIGGGMTYSTKNWQKSADADGFIRIVTAKKCRKAQTTVVAACSREAEINSEEKFFKYLQGL